MHIISTDEGGAPRGVADLIRIMAVNHDTVSRLCITSVSPKGLPPYLIGPDVVFLGLKWRLKPVWVKRHVDGILEQIDEFKPDILHSHLIPADIVTGLAAARTNIPHIAHIRDTRPWISSVRLKDQFRKGFLRLAYKVGNTRFCAVSRAAADHATANLKLDSARVKVTLNAIDAKEFLAIDTAPRLAGARVLVVGAAGRFVEEKGFEGLIRSLAAVCANGGSLRLRLVGRGSKRESYVALASKLGVAEHIEILPETHSMSEFLATIDVFVVASLSSEGLPRVLLEAMAAGCAVISTKIAGADEVIVEHDNGLLVEPGDVNAMASALAYMESNRQLLGRFGSQGRDIVRQRHTLERLGLDMATVYADCLARPSGHLAASVPKRGET